MYIVYKNSVAEEFPLLVDELHPTMNLKTLDDVTRGSEHKFIWQCNKSFEHIWHACVSERIRGRGCPFCAGKMVCSDNCLATLRPELIKEWDSLKNKSTPIDYTVGSKQKVYWICTKNKNHKWIAPIQQRAIGVKSGCPFCAGRRVDDSNSLATLRPDLVKEWHFIANNEIMPSDVTVSSHKKVWWKCSVAEDHIWKTSVYHRKNKNCPFCAGRKVSVSNSVLTVMPRVAKEWHPTLNDKKPSDFTYSSAQNAFWLCENGHTWKAVIYSRKNAGCPICNESKGEKSIMNILSENNISYISQHKFKDCKNVNSLPFDFFLPNHNTCIEYDGIQHFKSIEFFGGKSSLVSRRLNDNIKTNYCKNSNIFLLRISYKENVHKKITKFLSTSTYGK